MGGGGWNFDRKKRIGGKRGERDQGCKSGFNVLRNEEDGRGMRRP